MSCNYAEGLSPYENKGVLGVPEIFEDDEKVNEKCNILADWIECAKHVVVHTGAGISTTAGIPDFRGPKGVWTLEKKGEKPNIDISFDNAIPTKTHMALKHLIDKNFVHYIVSQNIDGLHLRSGVPRTHLAELHGNMFVGQCNACHSQFVRPTATSTVGQKSLNENCKRIVRGRPCRGVLHDTVLDWEAGLPDEDLEMSDYNSSLADINICLGTTLQIVPSGNLPLRCKKHGGKVVIVNLQPTKHDKKADLIINTYVDDVLGKVMKRLQLEIPEYENIYDPTKNQHPDSAIEWNIFKTDVRDLRKKYEQLNRDYRKRKAEEKNSTSAKQKRNAVKCIKDEKEDIRAKSEPDTKVKLETFTNHKSTSNNCIDMTHDSDDDVFNE